MRNFCRHPTAATWVVLKLQCSTALGLLLLPHYYQYERHAGTNNRLVAPPPPPDGTDWCPYAITALQQGRNNQHGDDELSGRLERWKHRAVEWRPVQLFLRGGRSLVGLFRISPKAEMEGTFEARPPKAQEILVKVQKRLTIREDDDNDEKEDETTTATTPQLPKGPRWAICHPDTDFSGTWRPLVTPEFKDEYNVYLQNCGTTFVFRQIVLNFCSTTREVIDQKDQGRVLHFHGKTPAGSWNRSLISSGAESASKENFEPLHAEFLDPDKELVQVEAWWENGGRVHKSILRNKPKVCGGTFETTRYLDDNGILVCESTFSPSAQELNNPNSKFKPAFVRWRYTRE